MEYVKKKWGTWTGDFESFVRTCRNELESSFDGIATDISNRDDDMRKNDDLDIAFGITPEYKSKKGQYMLDLFDNIVPYKEPIRF